MRRPSVALAVVVGLASTSAFAEPPLVPQAPVLTQPVAKGSLRAFTLPNETAKPTYVADGDPSEWIGEPTFVGGTSRYSRGELVYSDYVGDDHGADNGEDYARAATVDPLIETADRVYRAEVLAQALGEQFGAPDDGTAETKSLVADAQYGDANQGAAKNEADITEVRLASDDDNLYVLARFAGMANTSRTRLLVLFDEVAGDAVIEGPGAIQTSADRGFILGADGLTPWGRSCEGCASAMNGTGFVNVAELAIPLSFVDGADEILVAAGLSNGAAFADVSSSSDLVNVAFREEATDPEPIRIWNEHDQAFALHEGNIDRYFKPFSLAKLHGGASEGFTFGPGYFERVYVSDSVVNQETESGQYHQGAWQHYGLYLPSAYRPGRELGVTWWTHYRGGHAHDAAAWLPGLIHTLGEAQDRIIVSPSARGTSSWYVGRGYEDFLDVWDDLEASFPFDHERVAMSGYSMGGFASWLLPLTTPDRFAASFPTSGPPTQGLWAGAGDAIEPQNGAYDANAELLFTVAENARNIRYAIYQGSNDELVPWPGVARMASRLTELGYEHRFYTMPGYEHYTHAIVDDWRDAATYLASARNTSAPRHVTYRRWPALETAVNTVNTPVPLAHRFDGAYWVDDIVLRDAGTPDGQGHPDVRKHATVDATSHAIAGSDPLVLPDAGVAPQHWTPAPYTGLAHRQLLAPAPAFNGFKVTLTNTSSVTLDAAAMGLDPNVTIPYSSMSDGPTTVRLELASRSVEITVPAGSFGSSIAPASWT
jgi:dienelactone hydrolase